MPLRTNVFQCSQLLRNAPRLASDQDEKQTGKLGERKLFNICCNHVTSAYSKHDTRLVKFWDLKDNMRTGVGLAANNREAGHCHGCKQN